VCRSRDGVFDMIDVLGTAGALEPEPTERLRA
jgi:hypothetical protein